MRLTEGQILRLVNEYIGVSSDGYLGLPERFSYQTHQDFYPQYCDISGIDLGRMGGTTRERFIGILLHALPKNQAKIIRGVFKKFPPDCTLSHGARFCGQFLTSEEDFELQKRITLEAEFLLLAEKLENSVLDDISNFTDSQTVLNAIADAQILLKDRNASSALDRVHTVLHGYLRSICDRLGISYKEGIGISGVFSLLRKHPQFHSASELTITIFRAWGSIFESLNKARNDESLAHPNPSLLKEEEAFFAIELTAACIRCIAKKVAKKVSGETG